MGQSIKNKEITCASCGKLKKDIEFYKSYQKVHEATGRIPYCKACLKNMIADEYGNVQLELVKKTLQIMDRPFIWDLWVSSNESGGDIFGVYIKNIAMSQYKYLTWKDSEFNPQSTTDINYKNSVKQIDFDVTEELIDKWGDGYESKEYRAFEKKYNSLKNNYPQKTAMHTEALLNYIRYRVKEEFATAKGDVTEAGKWGDLASKAATAAKINPSQLSKADLSDGLSTFSELSQAVEKEVDIIPILPKFKYRPNDALDFNIWCYVNYMRDLAGMPICEYEDVYAFYDRRKADYVAQYGDPYGIFSNDTSEKNRDKIKIFIKEDGED